MRPKSIFATIAALLILTSACATSTSEDTPTTRVTATFLAEPTVTNTNVPAATLTQPDPTVAPPTPEPTATTEQATEAQPNVLLIILDDIGLDYFPGYLEDQVLDKAPMPTIEGLMRAGFVFDHLNVYATCSPTRASLLTGLHGVETGILAPGPMSYLDPQFPSIQHEIKRQSDGEIATAVIGKWHLVGRNFNEFDHPHAFGIDHYEGLMRGVHDDYYLWQKTADGARTQTSVYSTTEFTNDAIDWINAQDGPWFTWLAYTAPHTPFHLPPADLHSFDHLTGEQQDIRTNRPEYLKAMLESVDTEIGRLLESLPADDRDNTYIIVMGDNGTGGQVAQEPYASVGAKGSVHAGGIHTPMVVYSPFVNGNGQRVDALISSIDFYPTITEMFGYSAPTDVKGTSFYPLLTGAVDQYQPHEFVFSQTPDAVTVLNHEYKLIRETTGAERLYDLQVDPFEQIELVIEALNDAQQAAYVTLSAQLDAYLQAAY